MGSRFKKSLLSENVRKSLTGWQRRVKSRHGSSVALLSATATSFPGSLEDEMGGIHDLASESMEESSSRDHHSSFSRQPASMSKNQIHELSLSGKKLESALSSGPVYDSYASDDGNQDDSDDDDGDGFDDNNDKDDIKDESRLLSIP